MAPTKPPSLEYVCPACGKKGVIGRHFCAETNPKGPAETVAVGSGPVKVAGLSQGVWPVVGTIVVFSLLWPWLGAWSLALSAMVLALVYLKQKAGSRRSRSSDWRELVSLCRGSEAANRMVALELKKNPALSRSAAVEIALDRYKRDLSR